MISKIILSAIKEIIKKTATEIMAAMVDEDHLRAIRAELLRNKILRALMRSMMAEWLIIRNPTS